MRRFAFVGLAALASIVFGTNLAGCPLGATGSAGSGGGTGFNIAPTPVLTASVTRGVVPLTVSFSSERSTDDGLIVQRDWNFGDDTTVRDVSPQHTFTRTGSFLVTLTLTDEDNATATRTLTIDVTEEPVPVIEADRTIVPTAPGTVNFSAANSFDPDGTITDYEWNFGDGSREFIATLPHQFTTAGNYEVKLTVTDNVGVTSTRSQFIQVGVPLPTIEVRVPDPDVKNLVVSRDSPLWIQAVYSVDPSANRFVRAGLDGDRDICDAQYATFSTSTGAIAQRITGHDDQLTGAFYSPDGNTILTSSLDGKLRIQRTTNAALVRSVTAAGPVTACAFSPNGLQVAYGQLNGLVTLFDTASGVTVRTFASHTGAINDITFSPDGAQLLTAGNDRRAILWNANNGTILRDFSHALAVNGVAFNRVDPSIIATAGGDSRVLLWNVTSGENIRVIVGHADSVNDVLFSLDGASLYSVSDDQSVRIWNVSSGALVATLAGHANDVLSLGLSADGKTLATGDEGGSCRLWNLTTNAQIRATQPCISPIESIQISANGSEVLVAIAAKNSTYLDTVPPNGGDLNLTMPVALSLDGSNLPNGQYFLFAQVDTDKTEPVRSYANAVVNVVDAFTSSVTGATPRVTLVDDEATVVFAPLSNFPDTRRQICDLGQLARGDRVFLSLATGPGYAETYFANEPYSLAILDESQSIFAWFEANLIPFSAHSKLVIGHNSARYFLVMDGGLGVKVRIERGFGFETRQQRVLVDFRGSGSQSVTAGGISTFVPELDAAVFNPFFNPSLGWGDTETAQMKAAIMATLNGKYSGLGVSFISSDDANIPALPRLTLYVGGTVGRGLFGIADYIDPRNDTLTGTGMIFATEIGLNGLFGFFTNPVTTPAEVGNAIGTVAAHECGHLLGLRHTDGNPQDLMSGGADPTVGLILTATEVSPFEQIYGLPPIGVQDAVQLLQETVGTTN